MLSGRSFCDGLITYPGESYRMCVCVCMCDRGTPAEVLGPLGRLIHEKILMERIIEWKFASKTEALSFS